MPIDIQTIWNVFKKEKIEKQYLFTIDDGEIKAFKISMDETEQYGSLDLKTLYNACDTLKNKEVYIVHNHIKDDPKPSSQDFFQFDYFYSLFYLLNIKILDYLIVSPFGYFSFKENHLCTHQTSADIPTATYQTLPPFVCENIDFMYKHEKDIHQSLKMYNEVIFSTSVHLGCQTIFSGKDIFKISCGFENETIFIHQYDGSTFEMERLRHVIEVLNPIECFIVKDGLFHPVKKAGNFLLAG